MDDTDEPIARAIAFANQFPHLGIPAEVSVMDCSICGTMARRRSTGQRERIWYVIIDERWEVALDAQGEPLMPPRSL